MLSKKMVKYIIKYSHHCHRSGISISVYLDKAAQRERKLLREQMFIARRNGHHAVIRINQLYIDGKIHKIPNTQDNK